MIDVAHRPPLDGIRSRLASSCATVQTAGSRPATTAASEELGRELNSGCPENANLINPYDLVPGIAEWIHAVDVECERESDERVPLTIRDVEGRAREAGLVGSAWPGIDWGLAHDSEVWIGMSTLTEGNVRMVMVVTPSREVFLRRVVLRHVPRILLQRVG